MKIKCGPPKSKLGRLRKDELRTVLYELPKDTSHASAGATLLKVIQRAKIVPAPRAWDLLSLALSVICADTAVPRGQSPDGWTREIDLLVSVNDPDFWASKVDLIEHQLRFLTTDIWCLEFTGNGLRPKPPKEPAVPKQDCVALFSGGLDSFVGAIDLVSDGKHPYLVSQVAMGDKRSQAYFASKLGGGLAHLQLNHNAKCPGENERSQRSRSLIFLAYGVLVATSLQRYKDGETVDLFVCENGFISINPPLTGTRLGSLSTRTTHPVFLGLFQQLLNDAGLMVNVVNPYQFKTKGEMLCECADQPFLLKHASDTTSCGRFARNGFQHCGRCLPCLIRRASFHTWGRTDKTGYVYDDLSKDDAKHARFDDVRCASIAVAKVKLDGIDSLARSNLNSLAMGDISPYRDVLGRGIAELGAFLTAAGVK